MIALQKNKVSFTLRSSKLLKKKSGSIGAVVIQKKKEAFFEGCSRDRQVHPSMRRYEFLRIIQLCISKTVQREIDGSCLYFYSLCMCVCVCMFVYVCLSTSKKLSLEEINRCYVQLVVRDYSQRCDSISPRASAVVPSHGLETNLESGAKYINPGHNPL